MKKDIYEFWKTNSLNNIKPSRVHKEFPEGFDVTQRLKEYKSEKEYGTITEIGCGYGRLCTGFNPDKYMGVDISPSALTRAGKLHPEYQFKLLSDIESIYDYPISKTKLLYTVLLHIPDSDIKEMIHALCETTLGSVIVVECLGRDWRRKGNPPVFNREIEDYKNLFENYGYELTDWTKWEYAAYKNWNKSDIQLSVMNYSPIV